MGNPRHYSIELPGRCIELIERLWPAVSEIHGGEHPELGPLTSTFLLSMSMPIINVPLERIERHINKPDGAAYADDRPLSEDAVKAFQSVIQKGKLHDSPFYDEGAWHFLSIKGKRMPNIAHGLPEDWGKALGGDDATKNAHNMPAAQWISVLRNAMAHGGIAYLDENGQSSHGAPVKMYAFVSGKYAKPKCQHADADCRFGMGELESLNILRISEEAYRTFLQKWVAWLSDMRDAKQDAA